MAVLANDFVHLVRIRAAGERVAIPKESNLTGTVRRLENLGLVWFHSDAIEITERGEYLMKRDATVTDDGSWFEFSESTDV